MSLIENLCGLTLSASRPSGYWSWGYVVNVTNLIRCVLVTQLTQSIKINHLIVVTFISWTIEKNYYKNSFFSASPLCASQYISKDVWSKWEVEFCFEMKIYDHRSNLKRNIWWICKSVFNMQLFSHANIHIIFITVVAYNLPLTTGCVK